MEDLSATDKLLLEKIDGLKELMQQQFKTNSEQHQALISQTTKTNGRVTELEQWTNRIIGGLIISNIFVVPVVIWMLIDRLGT